MNVVVRDIEMVSGAKVSSPRNAGRFQML
jgi:hypothetical protein